MGYNVLIGCLSLFGKIPADYPERMLIQTVCLSRPNEQAWQRVFHTRICFYPVFKHVAELSFRSVIDKFTNWTWFDREFVGNNKCPRQSLIVFPVVTVTNSTLFSRFKLIYVFLLIAYKNIWAFFFLHPVNCDEFWITSDLSNSL